MARHASTRKHKACHQDRRKADGQEDRQTDIQTDILSRTPNRYNNLARSGHFHCADLRPSTPTHLRRQITTAVGCGKQLQSWGTFEGWDSGHKSYLYLICGAGHVTQNAPYVSKPQKV